MANPVSDKVRNQVLREYFSEKMRKLGSMKSAAKTRAARANSMKSAAKLRTSTSNLIKGAKAVAGGMSVPKAAREVAKCRVSTLDEFLCKWKVPPPR